MTPVIIRRFGLSAVITCSVAAVYCGFPGRVGNAQTPAVSAGPSQSRVSGKPPPTAAHAAPAPPKTAEEPSSTPPGKVWMDTDTYERDDHAGISKFHNWVYTRGDTVISGTTAQYNSKTDTLDTDDPVVMNDSKHHLTADKAHVEHAQNDPSLRVVILTGRVVMVLKPETAPGPGEVPPAPVQAPGAPAAGKLKVVSISSQRPGSTPTAQSKIAAPPTDAPKIGSKPPAEDKDREDAKAQQRHGGTATCDRIEYRTAKKFATLTGHVVFKQSFMDKDGKQIERTMTCEHAENDGKANKLHLFKPVHFEDNDGQIGDTTDDVLIGTKEGEETVKMMGHTHMTLTSPDDDEDSADSKSTNTKDTKNTDGKSTTRSSQ